MSQEIMQSIQGRTVPSTQYDIGSHTVSIMHHHTDMNVIHDNTPYSYNLMIHFHTWHTSTQYFFTRSQTHILHTHCTSSHRHDCHSQQWTLLLQPHDSLPHL